jgi:ComF family protein
MTVIRPRQWLSPLTDLFLQSACLLCDRRLNTIDHHPVCPSCNTAIATAQWPIHQRLQEHNQDRVFAWGQYHQTLRQAITALKYQNKAAIGKYLGQQLGQAWAQHKLTPGAQRLPRLTVVPIPLHTDRQQTRGYNQAELIARHFCQFTGATLVADALIRHQSTTAQFGLSAPQRQQNLATAFALNPNKNRRSQDTLSRSPILLIDDIYTTGATIRAARQVLEQSGWAVWGVAVVARGRLKLQ